MGELVLLINYLHSILRLLGSCQRIGVCGMTIVFHDYKHAYTEL